jgi:tyrosine-protein phosphatase SIW14
MWNLHTRRLQLKERYLKSSENTKKKNPAQRKALGALALSLFIAIFPACEREHRGKEITELPFIPNFHQVDDHIYRGGQPPTEAWRGLAALGVKIVIDLRREDEHSTAAEAQAVAALGMNYFNVPMKGVVPPADEQVAKVLALLNSRKRVFVHCKHGSDRTGVVIACYRIAHDGWRRQQALGEAESLGMGLVQVGLKHYIMFFRPDIMAFRPAR